MTAMPLDRAWPDLFTPAEADLLSSLQGPCATIPARQRILRCDSARTDMLYLTSGFVGRYRADRFGRRQLLGLQMPGDYIDLPAFTLGYLDHDLDAIGPAEVRSTPHERLQGLLTRSPLICEKLWRISLIDAAIHRYWIFRLGRLVGRARIANFFCETLLRLYSRELCTIDRYEVPLTQADLAESCGMTPIHANRMLAELREEGICTFAQGSVQIAKLPELFQTGQYCWDYLYLGPELDREIRERLDGTRATSVRTRLPLQAGTGLRRAV
ncbi:MAG TPA: Crp/Fnr family transcriptional regulator [Paracoccus sp. (in: a-proteobacteria)]|nr:Crp/Fnr family transcriptional regulator [Paracoccus sp. (in: a-proteobacteria)]